MTVTTITLPRALYSPPTRIMSNPISPTTAEIEMICFKVISLSSVDIYLDTNTELKKMATKSDEPSTTDKVIGKYFMNCPITPGHNPSGINAATVVAVEIIIGNAISPIPFLAASIRLIPSWSIRR